MAERRCENCKYWSDLIAEANGCGPVKALCECVDSRWAGRMMTEFHSCDKWEEAPL